MHRPIYTVIFTQNIHVEQAVRSHILNRIVECSVYAHSLIR